jgi:hypothetical protein
MPMPPPNGDMPMPPPNGGMPMPPPNGGMPMPPPMPEQPLLREGYVRVSKERFIAPNQRAQGGVLGRAPVAGAEKYLHPMYQKMAKHAMLTAGHAM